MENEEQKAQELYKRIEAYRLKYGLTPEEIEKIFRAGCEDCGSWDLDK